MEQLVQNAAKFIKAVFQNDLSGHDFFHSMRVYRTAINIAEAEHADIQVVALAALLHDVAEDSDCTIEDLKKEGFSADTIEALRLLTHEKSVPYMDYIAALKGNPIARKVKLADLAHNSDIGRLVIVTDKDLKRMEKYQKARNLLLEE